MRIMTFNLKNDTIFTLKHMRWQQRKQAVLHILKHYQPDVVGFQELTLSMKADLQQHLPEYHFVGQARVPTEFDKNEQTNIAYKRQIFHCLYESTFWLSSTPTIHGSKNILSVFPRICTIAKLEHVESKKVYTLYNTHLDHLFSINRKKGLDVISKWMSEYQDTHHVILMGDFNTHNESVAVQTFLSQNTRLKSIYDLYDLKPHNTIHSGFGHQNYKSKPIDYIFISDTLEIVDAKIIHGKVNGVYPSDHYPVICDLNDKEKL